ncbi:hypothetical protein [Kineococcus terrestris]|uniref:hypothetical protein n=1 Tax=Kineococcus terrestris TaxID=2044856 RepID=UPI0034DABE71
MSDSADLDGRLLQRARAFADELTGLVRGVVQAPCDPFHAIAVRGQREVISIRQEPATGISLTVEGDPLLNLVVTYRCAMDTTGDYLMVEGSSFDIYAGDRARGEPLFRYDFVHDAFPGVPAAHIQVHGHRDALAAVMVRAGSASRRGRRRASELGRGASIPHMSELHFPVGGTRFRPCLEDVLEVLVEELGVDRREGWSAALREGRQRWRHRQARTVVRDAPADAVDILRQLGYEVSWPHDSPEPEGTPHRLWAL